MKYIAQKLTQTKKRIKLELSTNNQPERVVRMTNNYPTGLRSFEPRKIGEKRWNGTVWAPAWVERYNAELKRIEARFKCGYNVDHLVNGLYSMAIGFDYADKK